MNDQILTYQFTIGANNDTGLLEIDKIEALTLKYYPDGATIFASGITGIWKGGKEKTAVVIANGAKSKAHDYMDELKIVLQQDAIGKIRIEDVELY